MNNETSPDPRPHDSLDCALLDLMRMLRGEAPNIDMRLSIQDVLREMLFDSRTACHAAPYVATWAKGHTVSRQTERAPSGSPPLEHLRAHCNNFLALHSRPEPVPKPVMDQLLLSMAATLVTLGFTTHRIVEGARAESPAPDRTDGQWVLDRDERTQLIQALCVARFWIGCDAKAQDMLHDALEVLL